MRNWRTQVYLWTTAIALVMVQHGAVHAQLIVNGSFEIPAVPVNSYQVIGVGGEPPGFGWTVSAGDVDIQGELFAGHMAPAVTGNRYLDINGFTAGTLSQAFATTKGSPYLVTFYYANNFVDTNAASPGKATVRVFDTGSGIDLVAPLAISHGTSVLGNANWTPGTLAFVATNSNTTLQFVGSVPGIGNMWLDEVKVIGGGLFRPRAG